MLVEVRCLQVGWNPTVEPLLSWKEKCESTKKASHDEQPPEEGKE